MALNADLVGKRYEGATFTVTPEHIAAYANATNDDNPRYHFDAAIGSPVFAVVPAFPTFMAAARDKELGADLLKLVHSAESHVLHRPVVAGDVLRVAGVLESVENADTGETFTVRTDLMDEAGAVVVEVRGTMLIRGTASKRGVVEAVERAGEEPAHVETTRVDEDQPARYADASGDRNPIHLDDATARAAKLPGVILHGMCTMAMAGKAVVNGPCEGDPSRVKRVEVEFSKPVFPGQELTTKVWPAASSENLIVFDTVNDRGITVIKGGRAELNQVFPA